MIGLLATVVLLFGFQAGKIIAQPQTILLIAIPLLIQTYGIFIITYGAAKVLRLAHDIATATASSKKLEVPLRQAGPAISCAKRSTFAAP